MAERTERDKAVPNGMVKGDFFIHIENYAQRISAATKQQQGKTAGFQRVIELVNHHQTQPTHGQIANHWKYLKPTGEEYFENNTRQSQHPDR